MLKKTIFIILFLCAVLPLFAVKVSFAGSESLTAKNNLILKHMVIKTYISKIPLKFKKYFHFTDFAYNVPYKIQGKNLKSLSVKVEINNLKYSGYHTAVIKLSDKNNGTIKGIDDVTFKTEIYAPVAVASGTIGKFQIIKSSDVKISYKNIPSLNDGYYISGKNIAGREAKFFITAGSPFTSANTERKRIINFGNAVNIIYSSSGLILKTRGMALQAGALNSVIRVKNIESGAVLNCIVKSDKTVAVR